jgi:hypothetical protein
MKDRKPYEKPAVAFEKELEALAVDCSGAWIGTGETCKGDGVCTIAWS